MANVAVVGGGAAGLGAAITLSKAGMAVSLFEAAATLGGHCFGVSVALWDRRTIRVDAGVAAFNPATFTGFGELLGELDLRFAPVTDDVSFMTPDRAAVWFSRAGQPLFRHPPDDPKQLLADIERFNRTCVEALDDPTYSDWSVDRYLDAMQFSADFRRLYFDPRAGAELSMPDGAVGAFPIRGLVSAWRMLGVVGPATTGRMAVQGGMHTYPEAAERWLRARKVSVFLRTRVAAISRPGDVVRIRVVDRDNASRTLSFDHVVMATNADQVVPLLEDASQDEARAYADLPHRRVRLVVHQDTQLMQTDRATWGAYNYTLHDSAGGPTSTVYVNRLQNLPASVPDVFVTTNPLTEPAADQVVMERTLILPVVGPDTEAAVQRIDAMQGRRRTWFCGGYLREPFAHEQAYRCGCDTADRLVAAVTDESMEFETGSQLRLGGFDDFLRDIPLFSALDARALSELQLVARPFQVEAGTTLFRQGAPPDGFYLIKRGAVDIMRRVPGDEVVRLATLGPSAVVGEMALLDGCRRSAHAVAVAPTSGYIVSSERFQTLMSDDRPAAFAVMDCFRREVAARARGVIDDIAAGVVASDAGLKALRNDEAKWPEPTSPATFDEDVLRRLPFFKTFQPHELREFVEPLKRYDFAPGQLVYAAGEPPRSCLVIVRGALSLRFAAGQATSTFSLLGPGKIAGELALIDGGAQPLACVAREPTIAFEVDRIGFELMRRGGSVVALKFFQAVTAGAVAVLRKASAHMARVTREPRVAPATRTPSAVAPAVREAS